jgi:hypothetical protein
MGSTKQHGVGFAMLVASIPLGGACGSDPFEQTAGSYGWPCKSDSECGAYGGRTCEPLGNFATTPCTVDERMCTLRCSSDADCASIGRGFGCEKSCGGQAAGLCLQH